MLKKVKLSSLHPNPYRHFGVYKLQDDKLEALQESIQSSGFWGETVIARPAKRGYELAFGHHRIHAAREELGENAMVEISVRDLDNNQMLKMMARENNEVYDANAQGDIELVKAAIEGYADGEIDLPAPQGNRGGGNGLIASDYTDRDSDQRFTRDGLQEYLALSMSRIDYALSHLRHIKVGVSDSDIYEGLKPKQAREVRTQINRAIAATGGSLKANAEPLTEEQKTVARKVGKEVADAFRNDHASTHNDRARKFANAIIEPDIDYPDIGKVCHDVARDLDSTSRGWKSEIDEIIKFQQHAEESDRYRLKQALMKLSEWADGLASKIDAPDEKINKKLAERKRGVVHVVK